MPEENVGGGADEVVSTVIPYKNPKALIGYYLGVFAFIPGVGAVLGPAALVLGILGLRDRRRNPQMHGLGHAIFAIIAGSLLTLVYLGVVILIIVAIAKEG